MLAASFGRLNAEFGFSLTQGKPLDFDRFTSELQLIESNYVQYLGLTLALRLAQPKFMEQFRRMLVSKLRVVFENASSELELWNKAVSAQVDSQLRERRKAFKRRRETLEKIQSAAGELELRIDEIETQDQRLVELPGADRASWRESLRDVRVRRSRSRPTVADRARPAALRRRRSGRRGSGDAAPGLSGRGGLPAGFARRIVAWQREHGRHDLPWQGTRDPYRVWLSEVMLQQTQVATVLGLLTSASSQRFPDVRALAAAALDDVLALWSGLGYYSRARNLHRCAQVDRRRARRRVSATQRRARRRCPGSAARPPRRSPRSASASGWRSSTATSSACWRGCSPSPATWPRRGAERELWSAATGAAAGERGIEAYTQGLMDLGATVCLARAPRCLLCPVREVCVRRGAAGTQERYPVKSRRVARGRRDNAWLELRWRDRVWLVQRPAQRRLGGPVEPAGVRLARGAARPRPPAGPGRAEALPAFVHVLTHLDWHLQPVRWTLPARTAARDVAALTAPWPEGRWFDDRRRPGARPAGAAAQAARGRLSAGAAPRRVSAACAAPHQRVDDVEPRQRVEAQQPLLGVERQRQDLAPAVRHPAGVCRSDAAGRNGSAPCADSVATASTRLLHDVGVRRRGRRPPGRRPTGLASPTQRPSASWRVGAER